MECSFDPKPIPGDWNGTGGHTNYSNKATRTYPTGWDAIQVRYVEFVMINVFYYEFLLMFCTDRSNKSTRTYPNGWGAIQVTACFYAFLCWLINFLHFQCTKCLDKANTRAYPAPARILASSVSIPFSASDPAMSFIAQQSLVSCQGDRVMLIAD